MVVAEQESTDTILGVEQVKELSGSERTYMRKIEDEHMARTKLL
jgi:hypothetical protein